MTSRTGVPQRESPRFPFLGPFFPQRHGHFPISHWCEEVSAGHRGDLLGPDSSSNDEPAVQRGVREVGPGSGGHLLLRGESKDSDRKHSMHRREWEEHEETGGGHKKGRIVHRRSCFRVPQNNMQECAPTVHRLGINGPRLLVSRLIHLTFAFAKRRVGKHSDDLAPLERPAGWRRARPNARTSSNF